jgi:tyrosine-protein kinase Etk/Wzc
MRLPSVEEQVFGKGAPQPGLSEVLAGELPLDKAARASGVEHLHILSAGRSKSGPAELLTAPRLASLLAAILAEYDRVVIDTPPALPVSDALRLAPHVTHAVLVARCGVTRGHAVQRAQHLLTAAAGRPLAGLVLNRAPLKTASYGSYGSYGPRRA